MKKHKILVEFELTEKAHIDVQAVIIEIRHNLTTPTAVTFGVRNPSVKDITEP